MTALLVGACVRRLPRAPEVTYTSFGRANPSADADVVSRWKGDRDILVRNARSPEQVVTYQSGKKVTIAELAKEPIERVRGVEVLVDTFPPGMELDNGQVRVADGSGLEFKGRFVLDYSGARPMREVLDDIRVLVTAAGGNLAIISWSRDSQTEANGAIGVVLTAPNEKLDPSKLRPGKMTQL